MVGILQYALSRLRCVFEGGILGRSRVRYRFPLDEIRCAKDKRNASGFFGWFGSASPPSLRELWRAAFAKVPSVKPLACQPKPWRRLVEARGVEPLSGTPSTQASTRLADHLEFRKR